MSDDKPKRRPRYKGTHPRSFKEKYKEQNPEKYAEDVAKIIAQGKTPAGMHRSIMVQEIMDFLQVKPGQIGLDATLGYGGHSLKLLEALNGSGMVYATDVDPLELPRTTERLKGFGYGEEIFQPRQLNFSEIDRVVEESGPLNFVLADLGVSSMQIDNPDRGFSFKLDGPLDLRLNPFHGKPASALLKKIKASELSELLFEYSDEIYADDITEFIVSERSKGKTFDTTTSLRQAIESALDYLPKETRKEEIKKACQRTFQALRIAVNHEFEMLEQFLEKLPECLAPGGRVAILTFHSGEDRRVKKAFQYYFREGIFSEFSREPIRPSAEECFANPRAKSAKMRTGIRG